MAHIEIVVAVVVVEIARGRASCYRRWWPRSIPRCCRCCGDGVYCAFIDSPLRRAPGQPELHRVVALVAAAPLVVDFRIRVLHARDVAGGVAHGNRELPDHDGRIRGIWIRDDLRNRGCDSRARRRRQHHGRAEPVCRNRLQGERRPRQLQRDAARTVAAFAERPLDERAVHVVAQLRQHRGSNEALTAGNLARNLADFDYDNGYNNFDVRHTFNVSLLYQVPYGRGRSVNASGVKDLVLGGWDIGGIYNARSGVPINLLVTRPDVLYKDAAGNYFNNPSAGRIAVINTPGGGNSRNVRRPNLVPGVDPFINDNGLLFLNPAAFATPLPGTWGDLERNSLHGPNFNQVDMVISKHFGGPRNVEFRAEVFNLFNAANFSNPNATLPNAIPTTAASEANKVQPGQAFTAGAAGSALAS